MVATGGTIASRPSPAGVTVALSGAELLAGLPEGARDVDVVDHDAGHSWNFDAAQMWSIAKGAREALDDPRLGGVVVTHGTDTVEQSALLCELVVGDAGTVVFTGAMRHASQLGFDGNANLWRALQVARSPRPLGTMVCVNDELHAPRWVTKTDTTSLASFQSPGHGPVARLDDSGLQLLRPLPHPTGPRVEERIEPAVGVLATWGGMDPGIVDHLLANGIKGLVLDASGAGNVPGVLLPALERARHAGVAIVVASRCATGRPGPIYGGVGGGASLDAIRAIWAGQLDAYKARVALMAAIPATRGDPQQLQHWFDELVN